MPIDTIAGLSGRTCTVCLPEARERGSSGGQRLQRVPLWDHVTPDQREGAADDPTPVCSTTSYGRFPSRVEDMDPSIAHYTILIVMMSWEVGFTGELNWESDMVQPPLLGLSPSCL